MGQYQLISCASFILTTDRINNATLIRMFFFKITAPEEQEVVDNMKKLLGKVEEMQKQRESLEKQLRDQVHSDDITTSLVVQEGDREVKSFFPISCSVHFS